MFTEFVTKLLTLILGYAVPAYECVKSIELLPTRIVDLRFWCKYWIIVNIWYIFDEITDALASRIPMYRELKLAFIIYLSFPTTKAADIVYKTIFRPVMMLIMLCEWNIKWRLLPHLCETLDSFICRARDLHWLLFRSVVHGSSRSSLPEVTEKNAESKVIEKNAESKVTEKNAEDIRFVRQRSSSSFLAEAERFLENIDLARGGTGGAESKVTEKNAESKVTEKNAEDIRSVSHPSLSALSELVVKSELLREDSLRARPRLASLIEMMSHRRRSVSRHLRGMRPSSSRYMMPLRSESRHLWGMETYENEVHDFVESRAFFNSLLCIWGKRGVGKSAFLRLLRDSYAGGTSFDHVLFVGAGTGGCTVHNLQHAIATCLGLDSRMMSLLDEESRDIVIYGSLRGERVLLLVDDVREPFEWSNVGLPPRQHKIICATRSRTVCAEMDASNIIEMRCLGEDDAWNLFKDKVGIVDAQPPAHPHVHQLAKKMVAECRGLPLALCVIGRAMSSKTDPREWRNAYNLLKTKHSQNQEDEGYSYLDILENELKESFLVTSLWPKDGSIPTESMRIMYQEDSSTNDEIVQVSKKKEFF